MTVTGAAVGHFYRQFSKKNKKNIDKKNSNSKNTHRQDHDAPVAAEETATSTSATDAADAAVRVADDTAAAASETAAEHVAGRPAAATPYNPRLRPAQAAQAVDAPPWLVADHFVTEHVVHEHVSVVPEPDHADPVPAAPDEHAASSQSGPATAVCGKSPAAAASSCAHVSCARNSSTLLLVLYYVILVSVLRAAFSGTRLTARALTPRGRTRYTITIHYILLVIGTG